MKLLVFGTGGGFDKYYNVYISFWKNVEILAFVDNNRKCWGDYKQNKRIISPDDICKYSYDAILIASVYEEDIQEQLYAYNIDFKKIYTRKDFFDKFIFMWYEQNYKLYDKKILVSGDVREYNACYHMYNELFNVSGFVSFDKLYLINNYDYDYILLTDLYFLSLSDENKIINDLKDRLPNNKALLQNDVFLAYSYYGKKVCLGNKYHDKIFLLIKPGKSRTGLGAVALNISKAIVYAEKKNYIPVIDMKNYKNQYLENDEYGKINAYNKFFLQPGGFELEDINEAKNVHISYIQNFWLSKKDMDKIKIPKMKNNLYKKYCTFIKKFTNKNVLGVLFRGTDYVNLKPYGHYIQPDIDSMIKKVKEKIKDWNIDLIYLCTEVQEACERFENEFGKEMVCYYPQLRYNSEIKEFLADISLNIENERTKRGEDYWIALNCLAVCNSLIAGNCSGSVVATEINGHKYNNVYLFELGRYGISK